ncbi:MAG TPA: AtpZ/AtpI family protein [Patescibacteria group bacterium]|nr:AtpZ/AtpI family protein [Patescibacteria group bacterium]
MDQNQREQTKKKSDQASLFYGASFAWQLGFLIVVVLLGFLGGGFLIDRWLHTTPFFIIVGAILGFAISSYETYHMIKPLLEKEQKKIEDDDKKTF